MDTQNPIASILLLFLSFSLLTSIHPHSCHYHRHFLSPYPHLTHPISHLTHLTLLYPIGHSTATKTVDPAILKYDQSTATSFYPLPKRIPSNWPGCSPIPSQRKKKKKEKDRTTTTPTTLPLPALMARPNAFGAASPGDRCWFRVSPSWRCGADPHLISGTRSFEDVSLAGCNILLTR